jgi:hypothetical protein
MFIRGRGTASGVVYPIPIVRTTPYLFAAQIPASKKSTADDWSEFIDRYACKLRGEHQVVFSFKSQDRRQRPHRARPSRRRRSQWNDDAGSQSLEQIRLDIEQQGKSRARRRVSLAMQSELRH